jgi:hypothetical protein
MGGSAAGVLHRHPYRQLTLGAGAAPRFGALKGDPQPRAAQRFEHPGGEQQVADPDQAGRSPNDADNGGEGDPRLAGPSAHPIAPDRDNVVAYPQLRNLGNTSKGSKATRIWPMAVKT